MRRDSGDYSIPCIHSSACCAGRSLTNHIPVNGQENHVCKYTTQNATLRINQNTTLRINQNRSRQGQNRDSGGYSIPCMPPSACCAGRSLTHHIPVNGQENHVCKYTTQNATLRINQNTTLRINQNRSRQGQNRDSGDYSIPCIWSSACCVGRSLTHHIPANRKTITLVNTLHQTQGVG